MDRSCLKNINHHIYLVNKFSCQSVFVMILTIFGHLQNIQTHIQLGICLCVQVSTNISVENIH